jgi:hypothetical protein
MPVSTFHYLRGRDGVDFCQLMVHPIHPISGEWRQRAQGFGSGGLGLGLSLADWRGQLLGLGLSGSDIHHQDHLHLECRPALWWYVWLNHISGLLAGDVTSW